MTDKLNEALQNVEMTYGELVEIANSITKPIFEPIDDIVKDVSSRINSMPIDMIRDTMLDLQIKAFEIAETKEKAALKAELAEALQKEKFAVSFTGSDGTAALKDKLAQLATSEETLTEAMYNLVANLFKTKLDQCHRLVDCLKSILMSRMQETKFMSVGTDAEIPPTKRMALNEDCKNQF